MKKLLTILLICVGFMAKAQTYNPSIHVTVNDAMGMAQGTPTDARSEYYNTGAFIYRKFSNRAEALAYLNLNKYRQGYYPVFIDSIGHTWEYWFRDGTADSNLVVKYNAPVTIDTVNLIATKYYVDTAKINIRNSIANKLDNTLPAGRIFVGNVSNVATAVLPSNDVSVTSGGSFTVNNQWKLVGNTGTTDGTNFIGTRDNVALSFRVNNQPAGRIDQNSENSFYGYQAGGFSTGINNTAIGFSALRGNGSGTANVAIGSGALLGNSLGSQNIGIGFNALVSNSTGSRNMGIGQQVLVNNTTGTDNVGVGNTALFNVTTGIFNTGIGAVTGSGIADGSYNTIIGANVTGLPPSLNNNIIVADGQGNQRFTIDSFGTAIIHSTTALGLPVGNTAQRPSSPATGYTRYNTDSVGKETYNGTIWVKDGSGGGGGGGVSLVNTGFGLSGGPITNTGTIVFDSTAGSTGGFHTKAYNDVHYQGILTLTTTGVSGAATLTGNTLNIPQYSGGGVTALTQGRIFVGGTGNVAMASSISFNWDSTNRKLHADSTDQLKLNVNTVSSLKGHLYGFGNSIMFGVNVPDTTFAFGTVAALQMGLVPVLNGVSSSTLEHQVPFNPFGAQDMIQRIPLIPFTTNKNDRLVFELGLNDARFMSANYNRGNYGTDFQTVLDSCFARGWTASQITIMAPPYMSPTSYTSLLGNPPLTQAIHLLWVATSDSIAIANGCRWFDAYHYMQNNGGNFLESNDSIHPNIRGQQILATGLVATMKAPVAINGNVANINGTLEAARLKLRGLDTMPANNFFTPFVLSSNGDVVAAPSAFILSNPNNLPNIGNINIFGHGWFGGIDTTNSYPQTVIVKNGINSDFMVLNGGVPNPLSLLKHDWGMEMFGNGSSGFFLQSGQRLSGFTPGFLSLQNSGGSMYFASPGPVTGNNSEIVQTLGSTYTSADLHAGHDGLFGHAVATGLAITSPQTTADFAGLSGTSTGRAQAYVDAAFFPSTDAAFMVKGNAGNYSGFSLAENSVAARWSMFIKPADQSLYFGTDNTAPSATTIRATLTHSGALLLADTFSFKNARIGTTSDSVVVHDAVTGAAKLVAQSSIGGSTNYSIATAPNTANYTVSGNNFIILSDLTGQANRTVTLPSSPVSGQQLALINQNGGSGFTWSTNTAITLADGSTITTLDNSKTYNLVWDGSSKWYVTN